jgi:hypothetical protein
MAEIKMPINPKPIRVDSKFGEIIYDTVERSIAISAENDNAVVCFEFNGRYYAVNSKSDINLVALNIHLNDPTWRDHVCWESRTRTLVEAVQG